MANITSWSQMAEDFCRCAEWPVQMLQEHHLLGQRWSEAQGRMRFAGWTLTGSQARVTQKGGTTGGTAVLVRKHISVRYHDGFEGDADMAPLRGHGVDWSAAVLRLRGTNVIMVSVYLTCGIGVAAENISKMQSIALYVKQARLPFIIAGDFNMSPQSVLESGWPTQLGAYVLAPEGCITCTTGSGSVLDFAVISACLQPVVQGLRPIAGNPFRPHLGLELLLCSRPRQLQHRVLKVPRAIPPPLEEGSPCQQSWQQCAMAAQAMIADNPQGLHPAPELALGNSAVLDKEATQRLGVSWAAFILTAELWSLQLAGVPVQQREAVKPCVGRGQHPRFCNVPVLAYLPVPQEGCTKEAKHWAVTAGYLRTLAVLTTRQRGVGQRRHAAEALLCLLQTQGLLEEPAEGGLAWKEVLADWPSPPCLRWQVLASLASKKAAAASAQARNQLLKEIKVWAVKCLVGGAAQAHSYTKKDFMHSNPVVSASLDGRVVHEPMDLMAARQRFWGQLWNRDPEAEVQQAIRFLDAERRRDTWQDHWQPLELQQLNWALQRTPNRTGLGVDQVAPALLKSLPAEGKDAFLALLQQVETAGCWPLQLLNTAIALIGKPRTGLHPGVKDERPIALLNMPYRVWTRARQLQERRWDEQRAGFWDTAVQGSSALQAGLMRSLLDEMACLRGVTTATLLWDLEKFYDSISLLKLAEKGVALGYAPLALLLTIQTYAAPRYLKAGQAWDCGQQVTTSIAAGCGRAIRMTRILLYDILEKAHMESPAVQCRSYVDDLTQRAQGSPEELVKQLTEAGVMLHDRLRQERLVISPKSAFTCNDRAVAEKLHRRLGRHGVKIRRATWVRDLGIANSSGKRRVVKLRDGRLRMAGLRVLRIRRLLKMAPAAKKLVLTGYKPQAIWGHSAVGMAPQQVARMRAATAKCCGGNVAGRCATTLIHFTFGELGDPAIFLWIGLH